MGYYRGQMSAGTILKYGVTHSRGFHGCMHKTCKSTCCRESTKVDSLSDTTRIWEGVQTIGAGGTVAGVAVIVSAEDTSCLGELNTPKKGVTPSEGRVTSPIEGARTSTRYETDCTIGRLPVFKKRTFV